MSRKTKYGSFVIRAGLIVLSGLVIMTCFTFAIVWAESSKPVPSGASADFSYANNPVGSFGNAGYEPIVIKPTDLTPSFVKSALKEKRGVIMLIYVKGATDDEAMLDNFNQVKATYSSQASFFSFESADVNDAGDMPEQLKIIQPPALGVISGNGAVYQLYTGYIDVKVMEQVVANAIRQ
jgi:hypothetical protein